MSEAKVEIENWDKKVCEVSWIEPGKYLDEGIVFTEHGMVYVLAYHSDVAYVLLTLIHQGRQYERIYFRYYKPRYQVTLAKRFAKEVCAPDQEEVRA